MRFNKLKICIIIFFISFINPASSQTAVEWNDKGVAFAESGEYDKAIEAYNKAIAIDPNYKVAWNNKGAAFLDLGEYKKAIEAFDRSIIIDPNDEEVWFIKGAAFAGLGEYKKAIEASDRALAIDPDYKEAWYGKGIAYIYLGEYNKATEAFDKALAIDPNYKEAWEGKGLVFYELGDYNKAIEAYDKALDMSEGQENDWIIIGGIAALILMGLILIAIRKKRHTSNSDTIEHICDSPKKRYENWLKVIFIPAITIGVLSYSGILILSEEVAGILVLIFKVAFIYITIWYGLKTGMKKHWSYILGFSTLLPFMWIISIVYLLSRKSPLDEQLRLYQQRQEEMRKERYLFRWDKIPGDDNERLIEFLTLKFNIDWIKKAKIEKTRDEKTIRLTVEGNYLSLTLVYGEMPVTEIVVDITIDDGRTYKLRVERDKNNWDSNKLSIYKDYYKEPTEWSFMKMPPLIPLSNNSLAIQIYGKPFEKLTDDQKKNILNHQGKTKY